MATKGCALAAMALALAACTGTEPPAPPPPSTDAPRQWVMPNLVGSDLQAAQDQIQALTGNPTFITLSHDATGQARQQVVDSNWKVCSQNIAPGATIDPNTKIDFGTVKQTENCP